jgi:hypothetical protein
MINGHLSIIAKQKQEQLTFLFKLLNDIKICQYYDSLKTNEKNETTGQQQMKELSANEKEELQKK